MQYDAFISYSHAADEQLAPAIQTGLQQLARPWRKRRALRVFRDETGLSVNPHLWESIVGALDSSEWFVVLASPLAAESTWVNREVEHFLASRPDARDRLLPVVTDGVWEWDDAVGSFGPATNCVPPALVAAFDSEPRHLDMSWARNADQLHLRRADFRSAIADIAAPVHGIPKDELESEDIRIYRRNRRLRRGAVSGLVVLAAGLGLASCAAFGFARNAQRERSNAETSAAEAERQADIARLREGEALDAEAEALASAEEATRQESIALQRADEARIAQAEAVASAEEAARQEALALQREQEALDAEAAAVAAQQETENALARVIEEQQRADENARRAEANADEATANAARAEANADEARANADEAGRQADEARRQQGIAEDNAATAISRSLAARSLELVAQNPELAVLTALEGNYPDGFSNRLATADARGALGVTLRTLIESPARRTGVRFGSAVAVDPVSGRTATLDGTRLIVSSGGTRLMAAARIIDLGFTPEEVWFSPGGDVLAAANVTAPEIEFGSSVVETKMFDAASGRLINSFDDLTEFDNGDNRPSVVDFDRTGARFLADRSDHVAVVETESGRTLLELAKPILPGCDRFDTFGTVRARFDAAGVKVVGIETSFEQTDCASVGLQGVPRVHTWELATPGQATTVSLDIVPIRAWWVSAPSGEMMVTFVDAGANVWWWTPGSNPVVQYRVRSDTVVTVEPYLDSGEFALVDTVGALYVGSIWDTTSNESMPFAVSPRLQWQDQGLVLVADGPDSTSQFRVTRRADSDLHDAVDRSGTRTYVGGRVERVTDGRTLWNYDPSVYDGDGSRPVDVSHDGSVVLTEGGAILDAATGSLRHRLPVGDVTTAMFADRGAIVLIFLEQRTDHYDSVTGQLVARSGPTSEFQVAASSASRFGRVLPSLSPDERSIAAANEHGAVAVVDVRSGTTRDVDVDGSATSVAWIGTDRLVVGFSDGAVRIVSSSDGQPIGAPLAGLNGPVYGIAADPDGERVFGFDTQRDVRGIEWLLLGGRRVVWDVASGGLLQVDDDTTIVRGMRHVPTGGAWRLQGGRWSYMPDDDDVLACREALSIAGDALEDLLGHPSVCTTVPELGG